MPTLRAPKALLSQLRPPEPQSEACLNCGTPLTGPFCSACGQRDIPPYPSLRELIVDAFWELSGWDGRFAATVRALVAQPGALTRDFLEGRRARYLSPLRLYLMASLVYFVLAALAPSPPPPPTTSRVDVGGVHVTLSAPERVQRAATVTVTGDQPLSAADRDSALAAVAKAPAVIRPFARRLILDPAGFKRGMVETMPRLLFALVPVFAAIVALFYRRRKFPEHLYFAIHLHAFVFLALTIVVLARLTTLAPLVIAARLLALCWIPLYATLAFRRTYGGSIGRTLAKELGIGALYAVAGLIGLLATVYVVALFA